MGMWPFSSPGSDAKAQSQSPPSLPSLPLPPPTHTTTPEPPSSQPTPPHLAPPSSSSPSTSSPSDMSVHTTTSSSSTSTSSPTEPLDPLLPRTMSCREAFDSAFYCSSLGGHFNDIYRYGHLRSCSDHWSDFWFCMRVKNSYHQQEMKQRMIQDRYREKEERIRSGPNSEHVWRVRGEGEAVQGAFGMGGGKRE